MTGSQRLLLLLARDPALQHVPLLAGGRVAERDPQQEAVELRLRERVGALVLDRVGGGEHVERRGQREGLALDRDLAAPAWPPAAPPGSSAASG